MNIDNNQGYLILISFAIIMIMAVLYFTKGFKKPQSLTSFLLSDRKLGLWSGAMSISVTFIWAPAIFICSLQSYNDGISGIFWFLVPNFLVLVLSGFLGVKLRKSYPDKFTLPELIYDQTKSSWAHYAMLTTFLLWLLTALIINCVAGGSLLSAVSGIPYNIASTSLILIALIYSLISGLKASVFSDILQMIMIFGIVFIIIPLCLTGDNITQINWGGNSNSPNPFDAKVAYNFGILAFLGLAGGWWQDQAFYQRVFAIKKTQIKKSFLLAAILFTIIPLSLSLLGFIGSGLVGSGELSSPENPAMIGPFVINHLLGKVALIAFVYMALCGLASTLDSAFSAVGSLFAIDLYKTHLNNKDNFTDNNAIKFARIGMILLAIIGFVMSLLQPNINYIFLTYAAVVSGGIGPVLAIVFKRKLNSKVVVLTIAMGIFICLPLTIYDHFFNIENPTKHIAIWSVMITMVTSCFFNLRGKKLI